MTDDVNTDWDNDTFCPNNHRGKHQEKEIINREKKTVSLYSSVICINTYECLICGQKWTHKVIQY